MPCLLLLSAVFLLAENIDNSYGVSGQFGWYRRKETVVALGNFTSRIPTDGPCFRWHQLHMGILKLVCKAKCF